MDKIAIITGSSKGIGAATAVRLASDGYDICVNYLSNEVAAKNIVETVKTYGVNAISVKADISSEKEVDMLFQTVDLKLGKPFALVNNAGILFQQSPVVEMTAERINKVLMTNVTGYFLCCKEAIRRMSTKNGGQGGVIVNVSSAASRIGSGGEYVDYAASKGAIDTFTKGLADEVASDNIRVMSIRPGIIATDIHSKGGEPDRAERLAPMVPLKRAGSAEEVAQAILWLASSQASYITGSTLDVTGGR